MSLTTTQQHIAIIPEKILYKEVRTKSKKVKKQIACFFIGLSVLSRYRDGSSISRKSRKPEKSISYFNQAGCACIPDILIGIKNAARLIFSE